MVDVSCFRCDGTFKVKRIGEIAPDEEGAFITLDYGHDIIAFYLCPECHNGLDEWLRQIRTLA